LEAVCPRLPGWSHLGLWPKGQAISIGPEGCRIYHLLVSMYALRQFIATVDCCAVTMMCITEALVPDWHPDMIFFQWSDMGSPISVGLPSHSP